MKKLLMLALTLTSVSVFAQVNECLSVTRTLFAKGVICEKQVEAVENTSPNSYNALRKLAACLEKSDKTCYKSLSAGDKLQQAQYFELNLFGNGVSCQKQVEAVENTSPNSYDALKELAKCNSEVFETHLQIIK